MYSDFVQLKTNKRSIYVRRQAVVTVGPVEKDLTREVFVVGRAEPIRILDTPENLKAIGIGE